MATPQSTGTLAVGETIRAVWDSGLYTERHAGLGIYWLDDNTIVVSADNGPKPVTAEQFRTAETWLYLWRLGEKPRPYGPNPHVAGTNYHCAARGELTYYQNVVDRNTGASSRTLWRGPPGGEREVASRKGRAPGEAIRPITVERTNCEFHSDPAMTGRLYTTDADHQFYLDFGKDPLLARVGAVPAEPIILMRADGSARVELPISNASVSPGATHFHTFDSVFYLLNSNVLASPINFFETWRNNDCWPIWRVDPRTAKTERLCIPFGPWSGAMHGGGATSIALAPTRAGLFFSTYPLKAQEEHGFYQLRDGSVSRILSSYVTSSSVSPNGCRIAFVHIPNDDALRADSPVSSSIVAIDVCSPDI